MFFFPYRADINLHRWPVLTLLLVLACLGIYYLQLANQIGIERTTQAFCAEKQSRAFRLALRTVYGHVSPNRCIDVLWGMHTARDRDRFVERTVAHARTLAGLSPRASTAYLKAAFNDSYQRFSQAVPADLTRLLWYHPDSWNPLRMLSAALAHASWTHVLGNLVFLFAFATTMEIVLGGLAFSGVLVALAILSHCVYSVAMFAVNDALPTVGLSGVVYGVMGLFAFFLPSTKIRCFAWFVVFFKRFSVPAWTLIGGFVGLDIYRLFFDNGSTINFAAHVGGATFGYLIGILFLRKKRAHVRAVLDGDRGGSVDPPDGKLPWSNKPGRDD